MLQSSVAGWLCGRRRRHTLKAVFYYVLGMRCVHGGVDLHIVSSSRVGAAEAVLKLLLTLVVLCYSNFLDVAGQVLFQKLLTFAWVW